MDKIGYPGSGTLGTGTGMRVAEQQLFTPDNTTVENFEMDLCGSSEAGDGHDERRIERELDAFVDPEVSSVRNTSDATAELEFEEGPPRHRNPSFDAFKAIFAEAQQIESQICAVEARLEQDVEPLRTRQILLAFRASKLGIAVPIVLNRRIVLSSSRRSEPTMKRVHRYEVDGLKTESRSRRTMIGGTFVPECAGGLSATAAAIR